MSQVTRRVLPLFVLLFSLAAPMRLSAQETRPAWEFGVRGLVLMNGYFNDASVNVSDNPSLATPNTSSYPQRSIGGSIRQTRIVGTGDLAGFAGGALHAEIDLDFFGAQADGPRTGPAARVRRIFGEVRWDRWHLLVGQEGPLVADVNPVSLAALGLPNYAGAGNLWLWIPQIRTGVDLNGGDGIRFGVDIAALSPAAPEGQSDALSDPGLGERSGRPMLEGRLRARWGEGGEVGLGAHRGWFADLDDSLTVSKAIVATAIVPLGEALEFRGEWYAGEGAAPLGGGAIGQPFDGDGSPMESSGGWGQLNFRAGAHWEVGAGYGYDDPEGTATDESNPTFRDKNTQYSARIQWRLAPAIIAFEYRHLASVFGGGAERTASHLNLAAGVEF